MSIDSVWKSIVKYDASLKERNAQIRELFRRNRENRGWFLKTAGIAALGVATGCTNNLAMPTVPTNEKKSMRDEKLNDAEWQTLLENGVADRFSDQLIDDIGSDPNLTDGAKGLLYAHFGAKEGANTIRGMWRKVATPSFLQDLNIFAGSDMKTIMRTRQVNGGFAFFDSKTSMYSKFIPADGYQGKYLRDSHTSWAEAWKSIGMSDDMTGRIQIMGATKGSGVYVGGKEYIVLTTPQAGFATLDSYYAKTLVPKFGDAGAKGEVFKLLEKYYLDVLLPINKKGVIQRDINWRNMIMREETSGLRLTPIDLDGAYYMIDRSMLARWQYDQLAERAARRGVSMVKFDDFVAKHPVSFKDIPTNIGEIKAIQVKINGMPVKVIIPAENVAGLKGGEMGKYVREIATQITAQYRAVPQGGVIKFDVTDALGSIKSMEIVKTTSFGDRIIGTGGKLGETIKLLSEGTKIASNVLLIWWLASEIGQVINPEFIAHFESTVAFPANVMSLGKNILSLWLDGAHSQLIGAKQKLADDATTIINADSPGVKEMFGIDKRSLLQFISYGITQPEISKILRKKANSSLYPAPSIVRYTEVFPPLISGAQEPINAFFSAVTDDEGNKLIVMWGPNSSTDLSLTPYVAFHKKKDVEIWSSEILSKQSWSLVTSLGLHNMSLRCEANDGGPIQTDTLKLSCNLVNK